MKYKKLQLLKDAIEEMGISNTVAGAKLGVSSQQVINMIKNENILIDGALYHKTKHILIDFDDLYSIKDVICGRYSISELAAWLDVSRQTIERMRDKGYVVYNCVLYSPKKYKLKK